jgi:hypothetical protein
LSEPRAARRATAVGRDVFVWGLWAVVLLADLWLVARFGSNVPYWDEWSMVPVLAGEQAVTPAWLWSSHHGHRIPVPRLVLLALYRLTGDDFRAGMYFNVLILAAGAAALMLASRGLRGESAVADAVFPLLLLNWGHYESLLWTWQTTQVLPLVIVCVLLALGARHGLELPFALAVAAGLGVMLLPLCGVPGLVYVPALALWVAAVGARFRSLAELWPRRTVILWTLAGGAVLLTALYFHRYPTPALPITFGRAKVAALVTGLKFVASSIGLAAKPLWPWSGVAIGAVLVATAAALLWTTWRERPQRRTWGLLLFLAGAACLTASVGLGKRGHGFTPRYHLLAAPLLCTAFFAWGICLPAALARAMQLGLLLLVLLVSPYNFAAGLEYGRDYHRRMEAFRADLLAGQPPGRLVAHHVHSLCPFPRYVPTWGVVMDWGTLDRARSRFPVADCVSFHGWMGDFMRMAHRGGIGDFRRLNDHDPLVHELSLSTVEHTASRADGNTWPEPKTVDQATLILTFSRPLHVSGIRVRRPESGNAGHPGWQQWVQVIWRLEGQTAFKVPQRYVFRWVAGQQSETIWVFGTIDQIAVHLGDADVQRQPESVEAHLTLLTAAEGHSAVLPATARPQ